MVAVHTRTPRTMVVVSVCVCTVHIQWANERTRRSTNTQSRRRRRVIGRRRRENEDTRVEYIARNWHHQQRAFFSFWLQLNFTNGNIQIEFGVSVNIWCDKKEKKWWSIYRNESLSSPLSLLLSPLSTGRNKINKSNHNNNNINAYIRSHQTEHMCTFRGITNNFSLVMLLLCVFAKAMNRQYFFQWNWRYTCTASEHQREWRIKPERIEFECERDASGLAVSKIIIRTRTPKFRHTRTLLTSPLMNSAHASGQSLNIWFGRLIPQIIGT